MARDDRMTIEPVGGEHLDDLAELFDTNAATRGCWCMWFIASPKDRREGWQGGNRARFEDLAVTSDIPLGLLAYRAGVPVGWCAAGPRSRYERAISPRAVILKRRDPAEDDDVWLVPCFFVRVGHRRAGVTHALLRAAIELAREHGATAIEGFPLNEDGSVDEYLGREHLFAACGFECIARPSPRRAVMRRDLRSS